MRDLKVTELEHVYGAGGCSPTPPSCYNPCDSGSGSKGSKGHKTKGAKSKGGKSKGGKSKGYKCW